jgi:hypothetical protein
MKLNIGRSTILLVLRILRILSFPYIIIANTTNFYFKNFMPRNRFNDEVDIKEEVMKFPMYSSSDEEFTRLKEKIANTVNTYKNNLHSFLTISEDEINIIKSKIHSTKFIAKNTKAFHPPSYYFIEGNNIIEESISIPAPSKFGYHHTKIAIDFITKDGAIFERRQTIEIYGKKVEENDSGKVEIVPLHKSRLILSILNSAVERSEIIPLVQSIQNLGIQDKLLQIEFVSESSTI